MTSAFVRPEATATITVAEPVLVMPARTETVYDYSFEDYKETTTAAFTAYSQEFETAPTGWTAFQTGSGSWSITANGFSSGNAYTLDTPDAGHIGFRPPGLSVSLRGLLVGRVYTIFAFGRNRSGIPLGFGVGVSGQTPDHHKLTSTMWTRIERTFTATAASMGLYVSVGPRDEDSSTTAPVLFDLDSFSLVRKAYTTVTNTGLDGWSTGSVVSTQKRSGTYSLYANAPAKAFTGLVVGHQYTLRGWYLNGSTWTQWSETFTAVSTAQSKTLNLTGLRYWDDVELIHHIPAVYTNTPSLPISQGKVRLDENYSPYVTANFQVPLTSLELLEQIDPRDPQRVTVTTTEGVSGDTRTYNLGLRSRTVDHKNGTIDIELASDEILLHDRKRVATTVDSTPRQYETSLRALCNWALGKIGASLAAGTADASIPAAWDAENLIPDPRLMSEPPITTYANLGHSAWDTVFPGPQNGVAHRGIHVASPSNSDSYVNVGPTSGMAFSVQEGKTYVFSATGSVRSVIGGTGSSEPDQAYGTVMPRQRALVVHATGPGFSPAYKVWHSPQVPNVAQTGASAGYRVSVKFTVPKGTTDVFLRAYHGGTSGAITWSQFQLVEAGPGTTAEDAAYFWGSKPADGKYAYNWRDLPDKSPSERTAIQERSPALFDWTPGQSLFDFLQPLINAAGLRLFCDENRVWRLVDPAEYEVPGFIVAQTGHNAIEGTDAITRNDDTWADAVVVKYAWTDADGVSHSAYDSAGPDDGKTITREVEREYTGPGAAASILASFEGRGRTQSVTVVGQYLATPGMDVSVNLPGTLTQTGKVRAVELDLGSGINRIETRGLTDAYPGSWILWNPTQTWSQVNNTLKWKDA